MRILAQGNPELIKQRYGGLGIEIVEELSEDDKDFDMIVLDHVLQQFNRRDVPEAIEYYKEKLKTGGDMIVTTPSLEWACSEIVTNDNPSAMVYLSLYGDDNVQNRSGFTLNWLRAILERAGFYTKIAIGEWYIAEVNGQREKAMKNTVIGTKMPEDPSEAIE
jgi:predicted SAM-dependent methyltransferase